MAEHREVLSVGSGVFCDLLEELLLQVQSSCFWSMSLSLSLSLSTPAYVLTSALCLHSLCVLLDSTQELNDFIGGHADGVVTFNEFASEAAISQVVVLMILHGEELQADLRFGLEDCCSIVFDPLLGAARFLEDLNYADPALLRFYVLPDVQCLLVLTTVLVEKSHGLLRDVFVFELGVVHDLIHLVLKQEQVVNLVLSAAELVEELEDLFPALDVILDVKANQSSLHKWYDLLQWPLLFDLDAVLVQGVSGVHELSLFVLIFAQLRQVLLVQMVEQLLDGVLSLAVLCHSVEVRVVVLALVVEVLIQQVDVFLIQVAHVVVQIRPQVQLQFFEQHNQLTRVHV